MSTCPTHLAQHEDGGAAQEYLGNVGRGNVFLWHCDLCYKWHAGYGPVVGRYFQESKDRRWQQEAEL